MRKGNCETGKGKAGEAVDSRWSIVEKVKKLKKPEKQSIVDSR